MLNRSLRIPVIVFLLAGCHDGGSVLPAKTVAPHAAATPHAVTPKLVARGDATCFLDAGGHLFCWGAYASGQPSPDDAQPRELTAMGRVVDVALGYHHLCALDETRAVRCIEAAEHGRGPRAESPTRVSGLGRPDAIVAGDDFTCALEAGVPLCWGDLRLSELGPKQRLAVPTRIEGVTGAVELVAGADHACARLQDGSVQCWGGSSETLHVAPRKVDGVGDAIALSADQSRTCAQLRDGHVKCWGWFAEPEASRDAAFVMKDWVGVTSLAVGPHQVCATRRDGSIACSGFNKEGEGGVASNHDDTLVRTSPSLRGATRVATGARHACALLEDGGVACWGSPAAGALGDGTFEDGIRRAPRAVEGLDGGTRLAGGETNHTCAVLRDGGVACWGQQLGPRAAPQASTGAVAADLALRGGCTVLASGEVACRGDLTLGAGGAKTSASGDRVIVSGVGDATEVAVSATWGGFASPHACALLRSGKIACWGGNDDGQLGDRTRAERAAPVRVAGVDDAISISVGLGHSCAVRRSGQVVCWGRLARMWNRDPATLDGEASLEDAGVKLAPMPIGVDDAVRLGGTEERTCAVRRTGAVTCWSRPRADQARAGMTFETDPGIQSARRLAVGFGHACAVLADGTVACWGEDRDAQLGDGERRPGQQRAVPVEGLRGAVDVSVGLSPTGSYSCALLVDGTVRCWGSNAYGQFAPQIEELGAPHRVRGLGPASATRLARGPG